MAEKSVEKDVERFKCSQAEYVIDYCFKEIQSSKFANTHERSLSLGAALVHSSSVKKDSWNQKNTKKYTKTELFLWLHRNCNIDFATRNTLISWFASYSHKSTDKEIILKHERQYILEKLFECQNKSSASESTFCSDKFFVETDIGNIFEGLAMQMPTSEDELKKTTYEFHKECPDVNLKPICEITTERWSAYIAENQMNLTPFILDAICRIYKVNIKIFCQISKEEIIFYPEDDSKKVLVFGHLGGNRYVPMVELNRGIDVNEVKKKQNEYEEISKQLTEAKEDLKKSLTETGKNEKTIKKLNATIATLESRKSSIIEEINKLNHTFDKKKEQIHKAEKRVIALNVKSKQMGKLLDSMTEDIEAFKAIPFSETDEVEEVDSSNFETEYSSIGLRQRTERNLSDSSVCTTKHK